MSNIKILYISTAVTKTNFKLLQTHKIEGTTNGFVPIFKYHNAIIKGLSEVNGIAIESINVPPITNKTSKLKKISDTVEVENKIKYITVGFYNIKFIKYITILFKLPHRIYSWYRINKCDEKVIVIDSSFISGIIPLYVINKFIKTPVIYVVADVYGFMNPDDDKSSMLKSFFTRSMKNVNGFIVITKQTNELLNKTNKPYVVVEGIVNSDFIPLSVNKDRDQFCMYAGSLDNQNGVGELIEAYIAIDTHMELRIYGSGNLEKIIMQYSEKYENIKFMGSLAMEEIILEETKANYLINPRPIDKEFTQYSFPSKTIEYLLSGTPVISSRLPGIPIEYDQYINYIDLTNKEKLISSLNSILKDENQHIYIERAEKAKQWVIENKSTDSIGIKIAELIKKVIKKES